MLHTVNKSPSERANLESCLRHAQPGAVILLIEDGVYGALKEGVLSAQLAQAAKTMRLYALQPDVDARGIGNKLLEAVVLIDYGGFVDLVAEHSPIMAWL